MAEFLRRIPEGDTRERRVCADCGYIVYENPLIVVGSVVALGSAVLLCRRAIEPRRGYWTLPAGYLELGETPEEGAIREAQEEAQAAIAIDGLLALFSIARIGQVQMIYRARFADPAQPHIAPGPESLDVGFYEWDAIPWDAIAFPSVRWALEAWHRSGPGPLLGPPAGNPPDDPRGMRRIGNTSEGGL